MRKIVLMIAAGFMAALAYGAPAKATVDQPCAAYTYTGTNISVCKDFNGVTKDQDCADVKYRVSLVAKDDPWRLDADHDGIGCEGTDGKAGNPLHPAQCSSWGARSTTDGKTWGTAAEGTSVGASSITLKKPGTKVTDGTEAFTKVDLDGGAPLTVNVSLAGGATPAAGAIRMFYFHDSDANTMTGQPAGFAALEEGHNSITVPTSGHIGLIGLTYDGSNPTDGKVTFSGLKLGNLNLAFKCPEQPKPSATPKAPSPTPTTNHAATLPVTGSHGPSNGQMVGIGAAIVLGGAFLAFLFRRRKVRVVAE